MSQYVKCEECGNGPCRYNRFRQNGRVKFSTCMVPKKEPFVPVSGAR